jgi:NDP-sugar pyrophosphorylase family protein
MINSYTHTFVLHFPELQHDTPWEIVADAAAIVRKKIAGLGSEYIIQGERAVHQTATIEEHVVMKGPMIVGPGCFIGAHAYLRGGIFLGENVVIGPGCEVKSSFILNQSALAHFNFVGDSIVGSDVNMEAGSVIASHYNERVDKMIQVFYQGQYHATQSAKFGALVGDHSRIGANAVLSPGTLLIPKSVVKRLELVEQVRYL